VGVSPLVALVVGLVLGGTVALTIVLGSRRSFEGSAPDPALVALPEAAMARRLLDLMDPAVLVVDADDAVVLANPAARGLGIVRGNRLLVPELLELSHAVRTGGGQRGDVQLPGSLVGTGPRMMGVHGVRLDSGAAPSPGPVALVLEDVTETRRTEAVRRDFVANVGHELKTPVGALALLAEAIEGAADDPEAVQRFAARIAHEADRLGRLVRELIDLSRLQGGEPLPAMVPVPVDRVLAEAVDRTRTAARAKNLDIAVGGRPGLVVRGVESQLVTAVTNLLANAVAYSVGESRIAVAARARSGFAEIAVTDSGIGIPRQDRQRVFERFYRVDQSRASSTGGTGLGLAIVKHVASNHGGSVNVWSEEGLGSTFTLRIPLAAAPSDPTAPDPTASDPTASDPAAPPAGDTVAADPGKGTA
jgi:two-component system sensor histidine kinase SenX3